MRWHDCYYHFWSAVLLNEGCCQASCMGMIILRGICGLVPPGWMWWMGRKWWCLKHSQVLPDPSHSIITVTQFDLAQMELRPHETHCSLTTPMPPSINMFIEPVCLTSESILMLSIKKKRKNDPTLFFVCFSLLVHHTFLMCVYTRWWCPVLTHSLQFCLITSSQMSFTRPFPSNLESHAHNTASSCAILVGSLLRGLTF